MALLIVRVKARPNRPIRLIASFVLPDELVELELAVSSLSELLILPRLTPIASPKRWTTAIVARRPCSRPLPQDHDDEPELSLPSVTASSSTAGASPEAAATAVGSDAAPTYRSPSPVVYPKRLGPERSGNPSGVPIGAGRARRRRRNCAGVSSSANSGWSAGGGSCVRFERIGMGMDGVDGPDAPALMWTMPGERLPVLFLKIDGVRDADAEPEPTAPVDEPTMIGVDVSDGSVLGAVARTRGESWGDSAKRGDRGPPGVAALGVVVVVVVSIAVAAADVDTEGVSAAPCAACDPRRAFLRDFLPSLALALALELAPALAPVLAGPPALPSPPRPSAPAVLDPARLLSRRSLCGILPEMKKWPQV